MGMLSLAGRLFRLCWRISLLILLISLPVTFFPIIAGIEGAWTFHFWHRDQVVSNSNALKFETESGQFRKYFNVPGAISFNDFMDQKGPFHIHRLGSGNWASTMHFKQPSEFEHSSVGVDKLASFDGLVRDVGAFQQHAEKPKRYWVYATEAARWFRNEWDEAFDEILQESYITPFPSDVILAYVDCAQSAFLCGVWSVKAPSLLSFTVEEETIRERRLRKEADSQENPDEQGWLESMMEAEYTYHSWEGNLHPVTVKVIELPLEDAAPLLPRNALPTPALQLRALLLDPDPHSLLDNWEPYHPFVQIMRRFNDLSNKLSNQIGTWRYHLNEYDKWYSRTVLRPIFGKEFTGNDGTMADIQNLVFTAGLVIGEVLHFPCTMVWDVYAWFFGLGWDGQPISDENVPADGGNWMEDMFGGFLDFVAQNMSAQASESAARAAVTEKLT